MKNKAGKRRKRADRPPAAPVNAVFEVNMCLHVHRNTLVTPRAQCWLAVCDRCVSKSDGWRWLRMATAARIELPGVFYVKVLSPSR